MNKNRRIIWQQVRDQGYKFISYISDDATVEPDSIGEGNIILPGCVIQPFVTIGNFNIFESGCVVCHHSVIDDFCFFAPSVSLAGHTKVGQGSFWGNNSASKNGISVGRHVLVGAGAYVSVNLEDSQVLVPGRSLILENNSSEIQI